MRKIFKPTQDFESVYEQAPNNPNLKFDDSKIKNCKFSDYNPPDVTVSPYQTVKEWQGETGRLTMPAVAIMNVLNTKINIGEFVGGKYVEKDNCIYIQTKDKLKEFCNFVVTITAVIKAVNEDNECQKLEFTINKLPNRVFSYDIAKLSDAFTDLTRTNIELRGNASLGQNRSECFAEYLKMKYEKVENNLMHRRIFYCHGWHKVDNKMIYLSATRSDCETACVIPDVELNEVGIMYKTVIGNGFGTVQKDMPSIFDIAQPIFDQNSQLSICETLGQILPVFLYCHLGFAAAIFQEAGLDVRFLLVLVGKTGSFKTSFCEMMSQVFGDEDFLNFESTPRAIELYRNTCKDMVMLLDDIFRNNNRAVMSKFENVLRTFGDGKAKAKSDRSSTKIERFSVRGACLVTAENQLPSQESSALRYLTVTLNTKYQGDKLAHFQNDIKLAKRNNRPSIIQKYFASFIKYLEQNFDSIVTELIKYEAPQIKLKYHRTARNYKIMCAIADIILQWGQELHMPIDFTSARNMWMQTIQKLARDNEYLAQKVEPYKDFLRIINHGIATNSFPVSQTKALYESSNGKQCGYIDSDNSLYVLDFIKAKQFYDNAVKMQGNFNIIDEKSLGRDLYTKNISEGQKEHDKNSAKGYRIRYFKKIRINKTDTRMLVLKIDAVKKVLLEE